MVRKTMIAFNGKKDGKVGKSRERQNANIENKLDKMIICPEGCTVYADCGKLNRDERHKRNFITTRCDQQKYRPQKIEIDSQWQF